MSETPIKDRGSSSQSSSTPTPAPKAAFASPQTPDFLHKLHYPFWRVVLISNWFYYTTSVISFLLLLTVLHYKLQVNYCTSEKEFDCIKCPSGFNCSGRNKVCDPPSEVYNGFCVAPGTEAEHARNITGDIRDLIATGRYKTVLDIKALKEYDDVPTSTIAMAENMI